MKAQVQIVGSLKLQNELMARFLESAAGVTCVCSQNSPSTRDLITGQRILILYDALNMEPDSLWTEIRAGFGLDRNHCLVALFNVNSYTGIENQAMKQGLRGIFFEHDSLDTLTKGIQAILNGDLWFSRKALAECLLDQRDFVGPKQEAQILTPREEEILLMIASGATNGEIADNLCISPNTVKTHVYNIYRKTKSPNRMQAALWAAKNL